MIPFKGRSSMKQYLPLKLVKRGFKVWAMADSSNGYLCDLNVYTGATGEREIALGEKVVLKLADPIIISLPSVCSLSLFSKTHMHVAQLKLTERTFHQE